MISNLLGADVPTYPFWVYQALLFGRSLLILVGLFGFESVFQRHPFVLPLICRSLKVSPTSLSVLQVQLTGENPQTARRIISSYLWVIRAAVVIIICYIWDSMIVVNERFDLRRGDEWNSITLRCATGWNCYALEQPNYLKDKSTPDFVRVSFYWDLELICAFFSSTLAQGPADVPGLLTRARRRSAVTCWRFGRFAFIDIVGGLGIAAAVFSLIILIFEGLSALLMRHRRGRLHLGIWVDGLIVVTLLIWVATLVWESLTAVACWVTRLTMLSIPIVLFHSRKVASLMRREMHLRIESKAR